MGGIAIWKNTGKYFEKYKFALLILVAGLFLMTFPQTKKDPEMLPEVVVTEETTLEQRLSTILSYMEGVGQVQVLLTEAVGQESVYQTDGVSGSEGRRETVTIMDENRSEFGLVRQVISPVYQGAIVVCQGGGNAGVRLAVIEAVSNVTGIPSNRITVLKMN